MQKELRLYKKTSKTVFKYIKETPVDKRFAEKIITYTINLMLGDNIEFNGIYTMKLNEISYPKDLIKIEDRLCGIK